MGLKDLKQNPVHTRNLSITTYEVDEDRIMVEGTLKDDRLKHSFSLTSQKMLEPGIIHNLTIRLLIKGPSFLIEDVEVDMDDVPRNLCRETQESLRPLIGHTIAPGFTVWVKETFGGAKGCTHLNALLLAMAPAAIQGYWSSYMSSHSFTSIQEAFKKAPDPRYLIDTCWIWRGNGPLVKELIAQLATPLATHQD